MHTQIEVSARSGRVGKGADRGVPLMRGREDMRASTKLIRLCAVVPAGLAGSFLAAMGLGYT